MPVQTKPFVFICGDDEFLVSRRGRERFTEMAAGIEDEFSREVVEGAVQNLDELEAVLSRLRAAVQTLSLFGGRKVVWLKDVNFFADTPTARAESAKPLIESLQELLEKVTPAEVTVLVTACPVDRRRTFFKWMQDNAAFEYLGGDANAFPAIATQEARELGVTFEPGALEMLAAKTGGNSRLAVEETRKLSAYLGAERGAITEKLVRELVPDFGEGDFFEPAEAFFSLDLAWTLDAMHRYFFTGHDARPLLTTLQGRNRLMIQLRVLMDGGELRFGHTGVTKDSFEAAKRSYAKHFGGLEEKSTFNIFTQNTWYLGKLGENTRALTLKRLIDFQTAFVSAFEDLLVRPNDQESILRELAIRCLG